MCEHLCIIFHVKCIYLKYIPYCYDHANIYEYISEETQNKLVSTHTYRHIRVCMYVCICICT